jgi:TP901 family phage tail tape measure protein
MATETTLYKFKADLQELRQLNRELETAKLNIDALKKGTTQYAASTGKLTEVSKKFDKSNASIKKVKGSVDNLNKSGHKMVSIFKSASIAIVAAFAFRAIIQGLKGVLTTFAQFESQMAAVRAISGATAEQFKELAASAQELGRTTVFTAIQVAELQEEFARLGFSTEEILAAQAATLDLASATGESLSSAAAIAGSSMRAFGLEASQITRVTNVMGASFTGSALNLERFTQSMKFAAPIAREAGFTIEETSAMLMVLADAGLSGSIAGNALKNIFIRLGDSNSKLNKSLEGTVQGLPQLIVEMERMKAETFNLTDATELLDKRSAPAFLVLLENIEKLSLASDLLNKAEGDINRMAAIRLDNLQGDFTLLQSATEGLGIAVGETFNFALRAAVTNLTTWVQGLAQSQKFINGAKGTVLLLVAGVTLLTARLAAMRLVTLATGTSMITFSKGIKLVALSFQSARARALLFTTAIQGIKAAIIGTGIGALVVLLGELVSRMGSFSEANARANFSVNRLVKSFNSELTAIQDLNTFSEERHDGLREMIATYGDVVGAIDLEILSLEQLAKVRAIVNEGSGNQVIIAATNERIEELEKERDAKDADLIKEKDRLLQDTSITKERLRIHMLGKMDVREVTIISNKQLQEENASERQANLDHFNELIKQQQDYLKEKTKDQEQDIINKAKQNGINIENTMSYRQQERMINLSALEDFRAMKFQEQVAVEEQADIKLQDLQRARELLVSHEELNKIRAKGDEKVTAKFEGLYNKMYNNTSDQGKKFFNDFIAQQGKISVKISEFRKFVSNLNTTLEKSGDSLDNSALSPNRLNKTKNRLKELTKIQISQINEVFEKQKQNNELSFEVARQKYEKEEELIVANLVSISDLQEKGTIDQIKADIKANKNKYQVLKALDAQAFNDFMTGEGKNKEDYLALLDKMFDEEQAKQKTNEEILLEIQKDFDNKKKMLEIDLRKKLNDIENSTTQISIDNMDDSLIAFGSKQRARLKLAKEINKDELKDLADRLAAEDILETEHDLLVAKSNAKLKKEENDLEDERIANFKQVYAQMSQIIMDFANNRFEAKMQEIEEDFRVDTNNEQSKFDRKLEIAEAAGHDTRGMEEAHNMKMRHLEEKKAGEIREIKRKQFMMDKTNSIIMAIINGAQAITKVAGELGIAAIAGAPIMSAFVAAQIASIAAQKFVGAKGGLTPSSTSDGTLEKFATGGMVQGKSHAQGGEKFAAGGRVVELEGGEAVINKRSTAMFKPMLSNINSHNGFGSKFAMGGITPGTKTQMDNMAGGWSSKDVADLISGAINSQQVFVAEADITSSQSVVEISEGRASIFS